MVFTVLRAEALGVDTDSCELKNSLGYIARPSLVLQGTQCLLYNQPWAVRKGKSTQMYFEKTSPKHQAYLAILPMHNYRMSR